jgi:hypothetical protein
MEVTLPKLVKHNRRSSSSIDHREQLETAVKVSAFSAAQGRLRHWKNTSPEGKLMTRNILDAIMTTSYSRAGSAIPPMGGMGALRRRSLTCR